MHVIEQRVRRAASRASRILDWVNTVQEMKKQGKSNLEIAKYLGVEESTVLTLLKKDPK